jgi:hypothetical protein
VKKLITICAVTVIALASATAQAVVTFDFEDAIVGGAAPDYVASANQRVTDYMTNVYGSSVTATGAAAWRNDETAPLDLDWPGKSGTDKWLRTYGSASLTPGAFQISFDTVPIVKFSGDFYVFTETQFDDFTVTAYDSTYGDRYNPSPSAALAAYHWWGGTGQGHFSVDLGLIRPATLLIFTDGGWYDIAIDNLQVSPVPAPGAILLGSIGVGLVGWLRRRRTI